MNREGKMLVDCLERRGWYILNGSVAEDEEGEYTYTGRKGETVIDYILGNGEMRERMERLEVGEEVDSDHHPVVIWMKGKERDSEGRRGRARIIRRGNWDEEGRNEFRKGLRIIKEEGKEIQQKMEEIGDRIKKTLEVCKKQRGDGKRNRIGWWDDKCRERKKEVRKEDGEGRGEKGIGMEKGKEGIRKCVKKSGSIVVQSGW
ncbi:hypothetical protein RF55_13795 [Lasius niger]|uniref:Endonuclease/exonuclease/phosphatase domain-containing protein n=1 Tax=Lasius niger TaxID=67767 RepID=A0A0J7K9X6_LASNI|nr:hypothetical protein RF55_13795 [Lasius niger]